MWEQQEVSKLGVSPGKMQAERAGARMKARRAETPKGARFTTAGPLGRVQSRKTFR